MVDRIKSDYYPLTSIQKDVWINQMLYPDIPFYNIGGYLRIDGEIDPDIFKKAMRRVVQENDSLRIVLSHKDTLPLQEFMEEADFQIPFIDFSGKENPMEEACNWMQSEFIKPFALHGGLLFRYALLKVSQRRYCYFNSQHHLVADGLSIALISKRLAKTYSAISSGRDTVSPKPSYKEFIRSDQEFFQSKKYRRMKEFWAGKYNEFPDPLIPRNHIAQSGASMKKGSLKSFWIKRDRYAQLEAFCRQHKATPYHLLLAALYIYFLRTTKVRDFIFGAPVMNRSKPSAKEAMGLFASASPVKFSFGLDMDTAGLLRLIGKELRATYRYQKFPLSEINKLCGAYQMGGRQLFDLTVSYEKFEYVSDFNGNPVEAVTLHNGCEQNSLAIALKEYHTGQDIRVDFSYNISAFNETEIERLNARLEFIMEEMVGRPDVTVARLAIIPPAERNKMLYEWNETKTGFQDTLCAHNLFEKQAERTPDATAVVFMEERITYRELDESANRLAEYLTTRGVGRESIVGISITPSIDMLIGLLAVMKAGGAYVPLDPAYPAERIGFMLEDSGSKIVFTQEKLLSALPDGIDEIICLDSDSWKWSGQNIKPPPCAAGPDDIAYIIYTSGSTGRPKGVMNIHRSLCNLINAQIRIFDVTPQSRVLQFASFSFDASVSEIFMAICSGATLILAPKDKILPGPALIETIETQAVTHLTIPPSSLAILPEKPLPSLKTIITAGEPCTASLVNTWGKNHRFINAYGPTESTVCASTWENNGKSGRPPIGRPIDNVQLYILDEQVTPVPIGVAGELHIAGECLARGYLNMSALTDEKFIKNPFSRDANSRLYKTGDMARYLPDGNIEFLGRNDNQVKIRGYRVELEEVEALLKERHGIKDAVVIMRGDGLHGKQIAAYFIETGSEKEALDISGLKQFLKKKLPDYMVPAFLTPVGAFPLTPNGKIDRNAFPDPEIASEESTVRERPDTDSEKKLVEVWKSVVGGEGIRIDVNLLEAGMDSLQALSFLVHIEEKFGARLEPVELFQNNSIKLLGEYLDQCKAAHRKEVEEKSLTSALVTIQAGGSKTPFFCVTAGYGDLLAFKGLAGLLDSKLPFYALQPPRAANPSLRFDVKTLASLYMKEVRAVQPKGPYFLGGYSAGGFLALEMAQQLKEVGEEVKSLILLGVPVAHGKIGHKLHSFFMKILPRILPETSRTRFEVIRILRSLFMDKGLLVHLRSLVDYVPQPYSGKIVIIEGRWASSRLFPWQKVWRAISGNGLEIHLVPGNHDSFIRPPYNRELAFRVKPYLDNLKSSV